MIRLHPIAAAISLALRPVTFDDPPKIPDELKPVVDKLVADAVEAGTSGLKAKNTELLGEVRGLKDKMKPFEGLDPVALKAMMDKLGNDEEAQLLAKGQLDEVVKRRTERMQADFDKKLKAREGELEKTMGMNQKLVRRATNEAILKVAAETGAEKTAFEDILLRAQSAGWTIDGETGEVVCKKGDEVILGKDGKTNLSPMEWAESLRETATHLWPKAQGANANGTIIPAKGGVDMSTWSPEQKLTHARSGQQQQAR